MSISIEKRDFYLFFYKLILIVGVFDGIRTKLVFGGPFTILKEASVFIILMGIFYKDRLVISRKQFWTSNFPLILYLLVVGTIVVTFNDVNPKSVQAINRDMAVGYPLHIKTIESFVLIYLFCKFSKMTGWHYRQIIRFFVQVCIWYAILNFMFYFFVPVSIIRKPWYGRISVGYPTADAQILCFAMFCLLFIKGLFRPQTVTIYFILLLVSIITSVTLSAYFTLLFLIICYLFIYIQKNGLLQYRSVIILGAISLCFLACFFAYRNLEGNIGQLMRTKVDYGMDMLNNKNNTEESDDPSQEIRQYQYEKAFSVKRDRLSLFLGGPISISGLIENEMGFLIRAYGYVGFCVYCIWLLYLFITALVTLRSRKNSLYIIILLVMYILCNQSLANTYMFGISAAFALLLSTFTMQRNPNDILSGGLLSRTGYKAKNISRSSTKNEWYAKT